MELSCWGRGRGGLGRGLTVVEGKGAPAHHPPTHLRQLREQHLLDAIRPSHRLRRVPRDHHQARAVGRRHARPEVRQVQSHVVLLDHEVADPELGVHRAALLRDEALERVQQVGHGHAQRPAHEHVRFAHLGRRVALEHLADGEAFVLSAELTDVVLVH